MIRGLVIGKFMPVHLGHVALIEFAASNCDELIVSMSYTPDDPIPGQLRFRWLKEIFNERPHILVRMVADNFDRPDLPLETRTKVWAERMTQVYPKVHIIFSSEEYGEPFAKALDAIHRTFDIQRLKIPVSASMIREKPFKHWSFIPEVVRPYFVKRICFYGGESTGKSTMTERMAEKYNTVFVPEVAREFLSTNDFTVEDIIKIGEAHFKRIKEMEHKANKILFCDTDAITTQIYSKYYLGIIPHVLIELEKQVHYDHYFLFNVDVPWVADGLRDLPHIREKMFQLFKNELEIRRISYTLVKGTWQEREQIVSRVIDDLLNEA